MSTPTEDSVVEGSASDVPVRELYSRENGRLATPSESFRRLHSPEKQRRPTPIETERPVALQPVVSVTEDPEVTWEVRHSAFVEGLQRRKASKIQLAWRGFKASKDEEAHVRTLQILVKFNEAAMLIQQWWRIRLRKKRAGIAAIFKSHAVNKLKPDPETKRHAKACEMMWRHQEASLRQLAIEDTRSFWKQTDFSRNVQMMLNRREQMYVQPAHPDDLVVHNKQWMRRSDAQEIRKEKALKFAKLKKEKSYHKKLNPEQLRGRYELRVSEANGQTAPVSQRPSGTAVRSTPSSLPSLSRPPGLPPTSSSKQLTGTTKPVEEEPLPEILIPPESVVRRRKQHEARKKRPVMNTETQRWLPPEKKAATKSATAPKTAPAARKRASQLPPLVEAGRYQPAYMGYDDRKPRKVAPAQWNSSPWKGDAPWAEGERHYRPRRGKSALD